MAVKKERNDRRNPTLDLNLMDKGLCSVLSAEEPISDEIVQNFLEQSRMRGSVTFVINQVTFKTLVLRRGTLKCHSNNKSLLERS